MKKRFVIIPAIMAITCAILVTIALVSVLGTNKYKIDTSDMEMTVEYNGELDLNNITIYNKLLNKEILVDESMIVSCSATDTIGQKVLVIRYKKQEFTIYFNVKYKVEFVVDGEVVSEQFVTTSDEIIIPQGITKDGYEFVRWDKAMPSQLENNITFNALFSSTTLPIPPLGELTAKYGTQLSSILLPSNVNGEWKFVDENQLVGNVGKRQFEVKFVPATDEIVEKYDVVTINVTQKNLDFVILKDKFVYDGQPHFPIWELPEDVDVQILVGEPQTESSETSYRYALNINDENYKGFYSGEYYIQKPNIVVNVLDHSADYLQQVEMQYQVEGFDNDDILDISINVPSILNVGTYEVGATVGNSNVNATINLGTLTINKIDLNPLPINPTLSTSKVAAVYGDKLSTISFENNFANGVWTWQNPDMIIDRIADFKANAVFTPNSKNYNAHIRELSVNNIDKKTLQISVTKNEFTYDSAEHQLAYQIEDGSYQNVDVLGNIAEIGAGIYTKTLTINHEFYKGSRTVQLIINKANPQTDFSNTYTKTWFAGIKLKDVKLNEGYTWVDENLALNEIGTYGYKAMFTPNDTANYNTVVGTFDITINKTSASLQDVEREHEFVYTGNVHKITGIVPSHYESELQYVYKYNEQTVSNIVNAGQYEVTIILPESKHYLEVSATTIVNVKKADINVTLQSLTATYEDTLADVKLPEDAEGDWSWTNPLFTLVGNVGQQKHNAMFTPTNQNYNPVTIDAIINVTAKQLTFNIVNNVFTYTGQPFAIEYTLADASGKQYSDMPVSGNTAQVNAGTYDITLNVTNSNYSAIKSTQLIINKAQLTPETPNNLTATYLDTVASVELPTADNGVWKWNVMEGILVGNVGNNQFDAIFVYNELQDCDNYVDYTTKLTIAVAKKDIDVPTLEQSAATYTGNEIKANIRDTELFKVTQNGWTNVAKYNVELTLIDSNNYKWSTTDEAKAYIPFEITIAKAVIGNLTLNNWEFGAKPNTPSATSNFGTPIYTYSDAEDGVFTSTQPTNAGTYYVKASVDGTGNYKAASAVLAFNIDKAKTIISNFALNGWVYGTPNTPSATSNYGNVTFTYSDTEDGVYVDEQPTDVGTHYVKAQVAEGDNYLGASKITNFTITKKFVSAPENITKDYTGEQQSSGLVETNIYFIHLDTKATECGTYNIELQLKDFKNYGWLTSDTEIVVVKFTISSVVNNWETEKPQLITWTYGAQPQIPTIVAKYGTTVVEYKAENASDYTDIIPEDAGSYIIRFSVTGQSYNALEMIVPLIIEKATIGEIPTISSKVYTGSTLTADVQSTQQYTVTQNNGGIDVNKTGYVVELTATKNYKWATGDEKVATFMFKITQAENSISGLVLTGWTFNSPANAPSATADFGTPIFTYSATKDGTYTSTQPTNAGTYHVKAHVAETDNYEAASAVTTFTIAVAKNAITSLTLEGWTFNSSANTPSATATFGTPTYTYSDAEDGVFTSTQPTNAGTHYVKASVAATGNYEAANLVKSFVIGKDSIPVPTIVNKPYNGGQQTATIQKLDQFEITTNGGGTNVNEEGYDVVLTIIDSNYKWETGDETIASLKFYITQADNNIELSMVDWVYDGQQNSPSCTVSFGTPNYTYSISQNGEYTDVVPTEGGTYYIKAEVAETTNYKAATATTSFKINQAANQITALSLEGWIYNQAANQPMATALYGTPTFTYSTAQNGTYTSAQPTEGGTYYVKAQVTATNNYMGAERTTSFVISKAETQITSIEISGWTYSQAASNPTIQTNDFVKSNDVTYYYRNIGDDRTKATSTVPTNSGSYYVYASIATSNNYVGCDSTDASFEIAKAAPQIKSLPTFSTIYLNQTKNGYIYSSVDMNDFKSTLNECCATAPVINNYANNVVAGTWSYESMTCAHGTNASSFIFTFTPTDTNNYTAITATDAVKVNFTIKSVAHIGSTYYPTIESALSAKQNCEVFVDADITGKVRINQDCTISSGVTLVLLYGATDADRNSGGIATLHSTNAKECNGIDKLALKNLVIINDNVTLTNNGVLEVAGEVSGSNGGSPYAGHTARNYAELRLNAEAKVVSKGTVRVTGFINEASSADGGNKSQVVIEDGALYIPFVLRDFRGGTYMSLAYGKGIFPFSQYQLRNISSRIILKYEGEIYAQVNVYVDSTIQSPALAFMGKGSNFMFRFTDDKYSYSELKYNPTTEVCDFDVYGGMEVNTIKFAITIKGSSYEIDTAKVYFPLNWSFDMSLNKASGQTSNAIYTINQQLKLMPGAILAVEKGVEATFTNLVAYSSYSDTTEISNETKYPSKPAAKLIVNGKVTCTNFGGNIYSTLQEGSATITIKSAASIKTKETHDKIKYYIYLPTKNITNKTSFYYDSTAQIENTTTTGTYVFTATQKSWARTA